MALKTESPLEKNLRMASPMDLETMWNWNRTCPSPINGLVPDLIVSNALSHPDAPAVCASDVSFTYMELHVISDVLARFLIEKGVGPETIVPLCFPKSGWATVSMLAVIKAGGAFTFLDPSFPAEVLQNIVKHTDAKFLLCSASTRAMWDGHCTAYEVGAEVIASLPQLSDAKQSVVLRPSNLLYVVFTSGSTGAPKGVCVDHSGFVSSALDFIKATDMNSSSRVLQFASYSFDASIFENLTAILCGGCLCTPDETSRDRGVPHFMNEFGVTFAFLTPSLVKSFNPSDVPSLKTLVLMGESPTQADVERWSGKVRLMNAYGPSECCVASAVNTCLEPRIEATNIGWPIGGLLWVVDSENANRLVPLGVEGELAIEGPHLGRGYLKDAVQTTKAFVHDLEWTANFPASRSRRIYLTGDIVRRKMDGSIVFIGRKDSQIKLRGMRVELGAIEQYLSEDHLVRLATVTAPASNMSTKYLAAVVSIVGKTGSEPDGDLTAFSFAGSNAEIDSMRRIIRDVRERLRKRVAGFMVPSTWLVLTSFPLMASGKIDRGKIKAWIVEMNDDAFEKYVCVLDQPSIDGAHSETGNPLVGAVRREISVVLNLPFDSVAPWKSFIGLGGDSISVWQLISQCQARDMALTVRDIMQSRSIIELAESVKVSERQVVAQKDSTNFFNIPFGLSPIQRLFFQWEPNGTLSGGNNRFNQSFLLRVRRPVSLNSMAEALKVVAERHPMLRCRFLKSPLCGWQQIIPKSLENSFHLEEHVVRKHSDVQRIILRSQCGIDMYRGPVFIVDLINKPQDQLVSIIAHHAVIDLVSWRVIMRELESLLQDDGSVTLPPQRSLSWPTWCRLQADYASQHLRPRSALLEHGEVPPPDLAYWGMEGRENKFKDRIAVMVQIDLATTSLLMDPERRQVSRTEPIDLFLSAIVHAFTSTFSDREVPTVFRESHGREPWDDSIDISSTVGWFTTMYPIVVEKKGRGGLIDMIRCVKDAQRRFSSNGWQYFVSRFYDPNGIQEFGPSAEVEIIFDFLGLYQQLERANGLFEQEYWEKSDVGPEFHCPGLFEITAEIIKGQLQLKFEYNKNMRHQADIRHWVYECERDLRHIVSELELAEADVRCIYTLSDFPLLQNMGYDGLDNLLGSVLPGLGIRLDDLEDVYATSSMQTGMLLSQAKHPSLYQCSTVFQVDSLPPFATVNVQHLSDTWVSLVERHSALRTIFISDVFDGGAFCQVVLKKIKPQVTRRFCSVGNLDIMLKEPASLPAHHRSPPHHLNIYEVSDGRTLLRIDINHACIDGASGDILVRDFVALYDGRIQLPKPPLYSAFVSQVQGRVLERDLEYWKSRLENVSPCHLPVLDDGVSQNGSLHTIRPCVAISVSSLSKFCQSHDVTLLTILKLSWSLVLRAYSGTDTVCFGYLVSGRDNLDADGSMKNNMFGALANILTCLCDVSDTLGSLLNIIHQDSLSDLEHQYCSLAHIQQSLNPGKRASQQPLFNTILNFQIRPPTLDSKSTIRLNEVSIYEPTEFACVVDITLANEHLDVSFTHWTTSISHGQAQNIAEAFLATLEALVQTPVDMPAKQVALFGEGHRKKIWAWNHTVPPRVDMCIHDVISRNAVTDPDASAIESWDAVFTYSQLDEISTRLARHLTHLNVGPGTVVPLCFAKSAWTIVSLLAVLKAGGVFVLLDPAHIAPARITDIIQVTGSKLILTGGPQESELLRNSMNVSTALDFLIVDSGCISQLWVCVSCISSQDRKPINVSARDPAYIFFTSGTTGKPKGSVNTHSGFCTAATVYWAHAGMSRKSRVLQYASYTFDVCLSEILTVLLFGGCVCVPNEEKRTDNVDEAITAARVDFALLTPSVARLVDPAEVPTLEILALCGEAITKADLTRWKGHVRLVNSYGPSECGVVTTLNECILDDPTNIGRPTGSLCWIVDPENHERLVPVGAIGELVVEGYNVAKGYFNDEIKTAEAFIKSPVWLVKMRLGSDQDVSDRVYKTGDLVRQNSDGSIKFIGRKDTQAKLHGQRMELGEVEHHLLSHSSSLMRSVAVEVIEPEARHRRQALAAFFTFSEACAINAPESSDDNNNDDDYDDDANMFLELPNHLAALLQTIQNSLADALPCFMIPTLFVPLLFFPLAPSGKLDRKALRRAAAKIPAAQLCQYSPADINDSREVLKTDVEKVLHSAWTETLGLPAEAIDRNTNFFHAGGDSLNAMRLVATARNKHGLVLTVAAIFEHPKLCDMAVWIAIGARGQFPDISSSDTLVEPFALLRKDQPVSAFISIVATQCQVNPENILDLYPCTALQEGLMTISVERKGAYLRQSTFVIPDAVDIDRLRVAWEKVVSSQSILRTRIVKIESIDSSECLQVVVDDPIEWLYPACSREQYLEDDLDIATTWGYPLNRFAVLEPTKSKVDRIHLIWTAHHALFDEWSLQLTMKQLVNAYQEVALPSNLPFNRFIAYTTGSDDAACATFWAEQMRGNKPVTLPQVLPNGYASKLHDCCERAISFTREGEGRHITTPTILRAAWALATGRYASANDVVFGASVHGRSAAVPGIERVNGPTMATVPVKVYLGREVPISTFIEHIQTQSAKMTTFEHWGIQNIARVSEAVPAFQNLLVVHLQGAKRNTLSPLGLGVIESINADYHTYPIVMECFIEGEGSEILLKVSYDRHVAPYVPQLTSHFEWLVQQLNLHVSDDSPLGTLDFCSLDDKACIFDWNCKSPVVVDSCIHELVNENAMRHPHAPAICSWDLNMSYVELSTASSMLAKYIISLGVRPEQVVPIIFEKSAWAIVTQLAVLKAGAVLFLLDPPHIKQGLGDYIGTMDATILLASETYSELLQRDDWLVVPISARTIESFTETHRAIALPIVSPKDAAYLTLTSSSAGKFESVVTEHQAFSSSSAAYSVALQISEASRVLQYTAHGLDSHFLDIFSTLIAGGCICVAKDSEQTSILQLVDAIRDMSVTSATMALSAVRLLSRHEVPTTLETLVIRGNLVPLIDRPWCRTVKIMNVYGPSECSSVVAVNDFMSVGSDCIAIGRGTGSRCWIVEPHDYNLLAPVGCAGELLVESPGLARGYLNEPDKTAEAFIHSPAWLQGIRPNSRLYKTGDLVRYNPMNGTIHFVGRKDTQAEVNTQRLQAQEMAQHLMALEHVNLATLSHPQAGEFAGRLVAVLSLRSLTLCSGLAENSSANPSLVDSSNRTFAIQQLSGIRAELAKKVPSYKMPSMWAILYHMPLTASLEVDEFGIEAWLETISKQTASDIREITKAEGDDAYGTNSFMEGRLRSIIAKVLGLLDDQVLLGSSLFSLGGDSISAIHIAARCRANGITIKTKDILRSISIREMARHAMLKGQRSGIPDSASAAEPGSSIATFGLTPMQRLYFTCLYSPTNHSTSSTNLTHFNQSILLRLTRDISVEELAKAIGAVVQQHGMLRARFLKSERKGTCESSWTQRILPSIDVASVFQHHSLEESCEMDPLIAASQNRLDAVKCPVFTVDYFTVTPAMRSADKNSHEQEPQRFLFMVAHHLVIDLVSWRIILQDVEEFVATGNLLNRDGYTFKAWAEKQEDYIARHPHGHSGTEDVFAVPKADLLYWGITPEANVFGETLNVGFSLDGGSTSALLGACNECFGTKPDDLFISALLASFTSTFPDRDLPPVFCEGHGRDCSWDDSIDLSSIVGWFTVLFPLQVKLNHVNESGRGVLVNLVRRVKDARARVSSDSWSYLASTPLAQETKSGLRHDWPVEILFNRVGDPQKEQRNDDILVQVPRHGLSPSPSHTHDCMLHETADVGFHCRRISLFDIHVDVDKDFGAKVNFTFNRQTLHQDKIRVWISQYRKLLLEIVNQFGAITAEPTLTDYPLMSHLTYEHIEQMKTTVVPALGLSGINGIADMYPCGPAQRGIMISQSRSSHLYNESFLYAVVPCESEAVDIEKLETAWRTVVFRHEALRTVIVEDTLGAGEGYYQVVLRNWSPRIRRLEYDTHQGGSLDIENVRRFSAAANPVAANNTRRWIEPAHSVIFCTTAAKVYMYLEISHSLVDASSMAILLKDMAMAYDGITLIPAEKVDIPRYADYIAHVKGIPLEASVDYWMDYLDGVEPCNIGNLKEDGAFPINATANTAVTSSVQSVPFKLYASSGSIFDFCLAHGLTPASVFKVSWALVLHAYTGMDRVCFGFIASGRDAPVQGIENIFGLICNMLVVKVLVDRSKRGIDILTDVHDGWLNSLGHQYVPLAEVQHYHQQRRAEAMGPAAASTHPSLFNTALSLNGKNKTPNLDNDGFSHASIAFDAVGGDENSEYDGTLSIWQTTDNSRFQAEYTYKVSCMTEAQAEILVHTFIKAVECIVSMSSRRLDEWCLVGENDVSSSSLGSNTASITATLADTSASMDTLKNYDTLVDELISTHDPNRSAICSWDGQLTYQELQDKSDRLARYLINDCGIGSEDLVPVCMEKSTWFVVSILAILKAGGAFVPMDANQLARAETIFEQTKARLILTSETLRENVFDRGDKRISLLVINAKFIQNLPQTPPQDRCHVYQGRSDSDAAYVIFTSGSSGTPKGVVIEHRAWCASAEGWIEGRSMNEKTRKLQYAAHSFDAAVGDILGTLMAGGCICIPSEAERLDNVEAAIRRMRVDMLDIPPSVLRLMKPENIPSVKTIVIAGESAPQHELQRWCHRVKIILAYGPTECSVESSLVAYPSANLLKSNNIGYPKKMCKYWVVDKDDHDVLMPLGCVGELLVEGVSSSASLRSHLLGYA